MLIIGTEVTCVCGVLLVIEVFHHVAIETAVGKNEINMGAGNQ